MRSSARRCEPGDNDREFASDIETVAELVREGMFERFAPGLLRIWAASRCERLANNYSVLWQSLASLMIESEGARWMIEQFFERPILNSPYAYPARHWELDNDGQPTNQILKTRRRSELITPVPQPKKRKQKRGQKEMHLAKGLEFRGVAVMACDDGVLPLEERIEAVSDESDLEEVYNTERHLLYVACTRARDRLLITGRRTGIGVSRGSERGPSGCDPNS